MQYGEKKIKSINKYGPKIENRIPIKKIFSYVQLQEFESVTKGSNLEGLTYGGKFVTSVKSDYMSSLNLHVNKMVALEDSIKDMDSLSKEATYEWAAKVGYYNHSEIDRGSGFPIVIVGMPYYVSQTQVGNYLKDIPRMVYLVINPETGQLYCYIKIDNYSYGEKLTKNVVKKIEKNLEEN